MRILALLLTILTTSSTVPLAPYAHGIRRANGTYALHDLRGKDVGLERFELYDGPGRGSLVVHSVITSEGMLPRRIETWAELNEDGTAGQADVIYREHGIFTHVTLIRENGDWVTKSDRLGGKPEPLRDPGRASLVTPATVTMGWPMLLKHGGKVRTFLVPDRSDEVPRVKSLELTPSGAKMFRLPDNQELEGEIVRVNDPRMSMILHSRLHVPVWVRMADGTSRRLIEWAGNLPDDNLPLTTGPR